MANQKPVLGVVTCTQPGCSGEMLVRSRKAGRGGGTKKYGHCSTCNHLEQKNDMQAHLGSYRQGNPVSQPEAAPVVKKAVVLDGVNDTFDPAEINHLPGFETPSEKPAPRSNSGALRWIVGGLTIMGIIAGVGYATTR